MHKINRIRIFFCALLLVIGFGTYHMGYQFVTQNAAHSKEKSIESDEPKKKTEVAVRQKQETDKKSVKSANPMVSYSYAVVAEDGYLTVYESDLKTVYLYTCIPLDSLPKSVQTEISKGKLFATEQELYSFLETYSS
ncbi:MAG: hypothetical protein ACI4HI_11155 [Lachnospiraceae bacterium]